MTTTTCAARQLVTRSQNCTLASLSPGFSSGFASEADGAYALVNDDAVIDTALRILASRLVRGNVLSDPHTVRDYAAMRFGCLEHEVFACLYLTVHSRLIACEELFRGTIDGAAVHPREVLKRVLFHNAAKVILIHNHPSGLAEPSHADQHITSVLREALGLIDVRVVDHLIVGGGVTSMAERGML